MRDLTSPAQASSAVQPNPSVAKAGAGQEAEATLSRQQKAVEEFASAQAVSVEDFRALQSRQSQLSSQLNSAEARAGRIVRELAAAPPEARAGMQDRLKVLQDRIVQIETDMAATGRQLANVPPQLSQSYQTQTQTRQPGFPNSDQMTAISIVAIIFVLTPLAFALARSIWRRASRPRITVQDAEASQRLARIEQAMDAVAIEVERVSEGQRFLTNLLAREKQPLGIAGESRGAPDTKAQTN